MDAQLDGRYPPERIIGDKAYDSDSLDEDLDDERIELIAPHRSNRNPRNIGLWPRHPQFGIGSPLRAWLGIVPT